jgi:hypothetical protein
VADRSAPEGTSLHEFVRVQNARARLRAENVHVEAVAQSASHESWVDSTLQELSNQASIRRGAGQ